MSALQTIPIGQAHESFYGSDIHPAADSMKSDPRLPPGACQGQGHPEGHRKGKAERAGKHDLPE